NTRPSAGREFLSKAEGHISPNRAATQGRPYENTEQQSRNQRDSPQSPQKEIWQMTNDKWGMDLQIRSSRAIFHFPFFIGYLSFVIGGMTYRSVVMSPSRVIVRRYWYVFASYRSIVFPA